MLLVFRNGADSFSISTCPVLLARAHRRFIVNADEESLLRELLSYPHGQKPCVVPFLRDDLKIVAQDGKLVLRHFSERHVSMNDRGGTTPYHSWIVQLLNTSQAMLPGGAHAAQLRNIPGYLLLLSRGSDEIISEPCKGCNHTV
jgi:hypothetical protein